MKRIHIILFYLLLSTVVSIPASAKDHKAPVDSSRVTTPDNKIIPHQRIGAIRIGMGMDEVQALLGKPIKWNANYGGSKDMANASAWDYVDLNLVIGFSHTAAPYVTSVSAVAFNRKATTLGKTYWKDMLPVNVAFQTENGISLGSSSFDLQRAYGNPSTDSDGLFVDYKSLGLSFWMTMDHMVWEIAVQQPQ